MCLEPLYICICHYINTLELNTRQASCYSRFHDAKENVVTHDLNWSRCQSHLIYCTARIFSFDEAFWRDLTASDIPWQIPAHWNSSRQQHFTTITSCIDSPAPQLGSVLWPAARKDPRAVAPHLLELSAAASDTLEYCSPWSGCPDYQSRDERGEKMLK